MKFYMAPMEGITGYIYRNAYDKVFGGVERYFTPFIVPHTKRTMNAREVRDILPENNAGMNVVPQVLTNHAEDFLLFTKHIKDYGYEEINLNLGCPSGTVVAKGKGAGFLLKMEELDSFLAEVFEKSDIGISIKTRIGMYDPEEFHEILEIYNKYPLKELIIHPRVQTDHYKNHPNMEVFQWALENSKLPICYNGDIFKEKDYVNLIEKTPDIDCVMLGRGLIQNPGLVSEINGQGKMTLEQLKEFHDLIYAGYKEILSGDRNVLFRMKELWSYMGNLFLEETGFFQAEKPEKILKKIKKAERFADYEAAVRMLF